MCFFHCAEIQFTTLVVRKTCAIFKFSAFSFSFFLFRRSINWKGNFYKRQERKIIIIFTVFINFTFLDCLEQLLFYFYFIFFWSIKCMCLLTLCGKVFLFFCYFFNCFSSEFPLVNVSLICFLLNPLILE